MRTTRRRDRGQALVEFSLVLIPFLWILMGIVDLGRGIYTYNAVSQAAREVARVTSTHPCNPSAPSCAIGSSSQTNAVIGTQQALVPGLRDPGASVTIGCTTITGAALPAVDCPTGAFVHVTVTVPFAAMTPFLGGFLPASLASSTHVQVQ